MNEKELWEKTLSLLKNEISEAAFKTWFSKTRLEIREDSFEIICPNSFIKNKIESIYKANLYRILTPLVAGRELNLSIKIGEKTGTNLEKASSFDAGPIFKPLTQTIKLEESYQIKPPNRANLSPHYTLENFVVGSNNRLAFAMATAVAKAPGANANNPLFIYASVGLGKTHLVQGIGNEIIKNFPSLRTLYTTSENFTNELIEAIQHRTQNNFRRKFRDVDVLIIDDIQFIAGRESTQEEFFNTFNALYLSQKQIIITSDKHPREITRLEERLTSRFGGGIIADIQNPDFETRLAILQTKAQSLNLKIDPEILKLLASLIQTNIRELEGGLKQTVNLMLSQNGGVNIEEVKNLFRKETYRQFSKTADPSKVIKTVCEYFGVKETEILGRRRVQLLVKPRQIAMYFLRVIHKLPLMKVGELLGGKDHTTILHGVERIEKELATNPQLQETINQLQRRIENE